MKVTIEFPDVMKMIMTTTIDIPDEASLKDVKELVLINFWKSFTFHFTPKIRIHGSIEDITLKDHNIKILTDDILRNRLEQRNCFQAVFSTSILHSNKRPNG